MSHKDLVPSCQKNRGPRRRECSSPGSPAGRAEPPPLGSAVSSQLCRVPRLCIHPGPACPFPAIQRPRPEEASGEAAYQQQRPRRAVAARPAGPVGLSWGAQLCTRGRALGTSQPQLVRGTHARHWPWGHRSWQPSPGSLGSPTGSLCVAGEVTGLHGSGRGVPGVTDRARGQVAEERRGRGTVDR